ncbi:MAG: XrtA/PEP-CTERM system-associated ATPase [Pseudomonadota bacterium]
MYESFYNLNGKPFQLSPDPSYFFGSQGHRRAMAYMRYGLQQQQGFIVVTGDVGTGKSMLVSTLFKDGIDPDKITAAKIVSTNVGEADLLRLICAELGISYERRAKAALLSSLREFFEETVADGRRVLLVIDEAQNMPRGSLEELRMLSNFEKDSMPLVQSFLLGQREFRSMLRAPGLEQLRQRVVAAYHLKPLDREETASYVQHRLKRAGWKADPEIDDGVFEGLHDATNGVPRRINMLFDRLLLNTFLDESHHISRQDFDSVRAEIENEHSDTGTHSTEASTPDAEAPTKKPGPKRASKAGAQESSVAQAGIEKVLKRLDDLQRRVDDLAAQVHVQSAQNLTTEPSDEHEQGFPVWRTAFIVGVFAVLAVSSVIGYAIFGGGR